MSPEQLPVPAPTPPPWLTQTVAPLLVTAVISLCALFLQVTKIETGLTKVLDDMQELKNDNKERLADIDRRVRALELRPR